MKRSASYPAEDKELKNMYEELSFLVPESSPLITPYGGRLVDLPVRVEAFEALKAYASQLPSIKISPRSVCDLELLATGAFSPLDRFMGQEDHQRVLDEMRLMNGYIFPIPITLPVETGLDLHLDQDIALRNNEYELLAIMTISEIYEWDRTEVAERVFGTQDLHHPLVAEMHNWGALNISGKLRILHLPRHYDFQDLWLTPSQTRAKLAANGRQNVIAFQPDNMWRHLDEELIEQVVDDVDGTLLLHPVVGLTKIGDIEYYTRTRYYKTLVDTYHKTDRILLSLLPLAPRMAGPREALLQALIHRNYGASHMIVGHNHASPGNSSTSKSFYSPQDAQILVEKHSQELGIKIVPEPVRYKETAGKSELTSLFPISNRIEAGSNGNGRSLSSMQSQSETTQLLTEANWPYHRRGVCIWFTGLSGAGKSTTAQILTWLLLEHGRRVTLLDGDVIRTHLSKGLGFSKEDRDTNVRRIGFVASELVRHGGTVVCAVVSPYRVARNDVRNMVGKDQFVEVFVNTPLEVCENRDVKGLYAKARRGELKGFTGIDDPYEPPDHPEITLDTVDDTPQNNANLIVEYLIEQGFVRVAQAHC